MLKGKKSDSLLLLKFLMDCLGYVAYFQDIVIVLGRGTFIYSIYEEDQKKGNLQVS